MTASLLQCDRILDDPVLTGAAHLPLLAGIFGDRTENLNNPAIQNAESDLIPTLKNLGAEPKI